MLAKRTARHLPALIALCVLLVPPVANAVAVEDARKLVNLKARELFMQHRRAIKALEGTLRNPAFKAYFAVEDPAARAAHVAEIEQSALKMQRFFEIEEMCLIDSEGKEVVRVVGGELSHDLSHEEAQNPFFAPAFAMPEGEVLVSEIYRSPDNGLWVLAYVTPIAALGSNRGLLHYELEVATIARELYEGIGPGQALLAFDEKGRLLFDSRRAEGLPAADGVVLPTAVDGRTLQEIEAAEGSMLDGHAVALKKVRGWTLVALQRQG